MRIQHNIPAMNSYRNYNKNANALSSNLEKLSSGYRINRAGDDAAGLAISEKMRAQITGLDAAQKNVQDGISLVKTAEGALQEVQDMLNRMVYLATQSANGTYDNEVDRANLQKEVDALIEEIDRISESANFNGINLLDGTAGGSLSVENWGTSDDKAEFKLSLPTDAKGKDWLGGSIVIGDKTYTFEYDSEQKNKAKLEGNVIKFGDATDAAAVATALKGVSFSAKTISDKDLEFTAKADGGALVFTADDKGEVDALTLGKMEANVGLSLQIGDTSDDYNKLNVGIMKMDSASLLVNGIDISDQTSASTAINRIKNAINMVSSTRGGLGAIQNRLEHTANNLSVMEENIQNAESAIRDTDIADEMTAYTKNNILLQSAQAMLAQANQVPQGVLQLLQ